MPAIATVVPHLGHVLLLAFEDRAVLLFALLLQLLLQPVLQLLHARVRSLGELARRYDDGLLTRQGPAETTRVQALNQALLLRRAWYH